MEADRLKWDKRYEGDALLHSRTPTRFLQESMPLLRSLSPGNRALDIACGEGRNSVFLAQNGFHVTAVDISGQGLAKAAHRAAAEGLEIDFQQVDLDLFRLHGTYDLAININFLMRGIFPATVALLSPGGLFLVETLLEGPGAPPATNPSFLLKAGELASIFAGIPGDILYSREQSDTDMPIASLIFRKAGACQDSPLPAD